MKICRNTVRIGSATLLPIIIAATNVLPVFSAAPNLQAPSGLSLLEVKMTGDEFVVLQNNTGATITDLASYWVYVFNKTDPSIAGATSSGQQLPAGQLDVGQTILLSSKAKANCGAQISWTLGPSLGDSSGFVQVTKQATIGGAVVLTPSDSVSWGTDTSTKPQTVGVIPKVPSSTAAPLGMYYRASTGWQAADLDATMPCQLNVAAVGSTPASSISSTLSTTKTQPPATIVSVTGATGDEVAVPAIPIADAGLQAPQITELVPNPEGTGTDETDEFIELYNPNTAPFHLVGFTLQTGATTKHNYIFPDGTILPPQSFTAFYSADTNLSLSNGSGQAALLDPLGAAIAQADPYGTAKDGQAWARADGKWYWTTQPTPNAANIVKQPVASSSKSVARTKSKTPTDKTSSGVVKGAATSRAGTSSAQSTTAAGTVAPAPIHRYVLAAVAALAVGYGIYEYRHDLGNRIHQFRANRAARRSPRAQVARR